MFPPNRLCTSTRMGDVSNFTEAFWKTLVPGRDIESFAKGFFSRKTHLSQGIGRSDHEKTKARTQGKKQHIAYVTNTTHICSPQKNSSLAGVSHSEISSPEQISGKNRPVREKFSRCASRRFPGCAAYHVSDSPAYWELVK